MKTNKRPPASILFIFGGSGDLNYRKLTPALYNLFLDEWMPDKFAIAGIGRSSYSNEEYHGHLLDGIKNFPVVRMSRTSTGKISASMFRIFKWMAMMLLLTTKSRIW